MICVAWVLMSIPILLLGAGLIDRPSDSYKIAGFVSAVVFLPIWWSLYFVVRAIVG